jgi:hypothetical protein
MNDTTSPSTRTRVERMAGSLSLALWHDGTVPDELGGYRHRYGYRIADTTSPQIPPHIGRDIHSGVGAQVDTTKMMGTLVELLSAAAEAYQDEMDHPGSPPENQGLFPNWVTDAAYQFSDELAMLALDLEQQPEPHGLAGREGPRPSRTPESGSPTPSGSVGAGPVWPPGRYYTVTLRQGAAGHAMLDLIERDGAGAAIEHLARGDHGAATLDAALFNRELYLQVPTRPGALVAEHRPYVLAYHPGTGDVHLLRELPTDLPRPASWPARYTGVPSEPPATHSPVLAQSPRSAPNRAPGPMRPQPPRPRTEDGLSL